jgi:Cu/Ag efflux protein CusF
MPGMTMMFPVSDKKMLGGIKEGVPGLAKQQPTSGGSVGLS